MEITPFEQLPITTMTLVFSLVHEVNYHLASLLLPIRKMNVPAFRPNRKYKLPHCKIPGSIIAMRPPRKGQVRGLIESSAPPFKNAVTMRISTQKKNISLKLSAFSIQMCGASSLADGTEAATHVIDHLLLLQRVMTRIQKQESSTLQAFSWICEASRGEPMLREFFEIKQYPAYDLEVRTLVDDHKLLDTIDLVPPADLQLDEEALQLARGLQDYYIYHSDYAAKIWLALQGMNVISGPSAIDHITEAMVNYNYSLGFEVNRIQLKERIDGVNGFLSHYNNALVTSVTVELPYAPSTEKDVKRNKNKIPHHTFLIYRSGSVTQSGPGGALMREAYELFMDTIQQIYPFIIYVPQECS